MMFNYLKAGIFWPFSILNDSEVSVKPVAIQFIELPELH